MESSRTLQPLDEIESIDKPFGVQANLAGARLYTRHDTISLDPNLAGYKELVYKLQCLTGSPNP